MNSNTNVKVNSQASRKRPSGFATMARMIVLVKPLAAYMALAIFTGVLGHIAASIITILGGYGIVNGFIFKQEFDFTWLFIILGVSALLRGVFRYIEQTCNHYIAFKLLALIRDVVFKSLRRLCPAKLEGKQKGNLISVITSDIELLEVFYAHTISPVAIATIFSLIMAGAIALFNVKLGVFALIAYFVVGAIIPIIIGKMGKNTAREMRDITGEMSSFALENLRGLGEILQYDKGQLRTDQMTGKTRAFSKKELRHKTGIGINMAITNTAIMVFDFGMVFLAVNEASKLGGTFNDVLIPILIMFSTFGPVVALANLGSTLQTTIAASERVFEIIDEAPVVEEKTDGVDVGVDGVVAKNVCFSYDQQLILDSLDVEIPKGKIVGIVGKSGSGKSTFLKLLMRFWDTDKGTIRISGEEITDINTSNLRDIQSFVTQDTELFHDTIINNIRIGRLDATEEEVVEACKKASIHDFIMTLPQGYQSQVGELGETLSGGERQRIGLARAFLHDGPMMLLDEPTSNLDSLNEGVILKSIADDDSGKTIVLVSHRKSTMKVADKVYSVENGRVS